MPYVPRQRGFTLIELIMVIVILGAIGGMVSVFMRGPIDAYLASARRAALTDVADTTVRRIARDVRKSLPNSIRMASAGTSCIEFIPTKTGGRYRSDTTPAGLDFSNNDTSFNMLGANTSLPSDQRIAPAVGGVAGDLIAIYNLGITGASAYNQDNTAVVTAVTPETVAPNAETTLTFVRSAAFPLTSGSNRFHIIPALEQVVGYACANTGINAAGQGTGTLYRYTAALPYAQPGICPAPPVGGASSVVTVATLATNVSSCSFDYSGSDLQRNALLRIALQMTVQSESVSLYHEVHVNNTP